MLQNLAYLPHSCFVYSSFKDLSYLQPAISFKVLYASQSSHMRCIHCSYETNQSVENLATEAGPLKDISPVRLLIYIGLVFFSVADTYERL